MIERTHLTDGKPERLWRWQDRNQRDPWTDECNPPLCLKIAAERIALAYGINGICDPGYIANVIAAELRIGDGASHFFTDPCGGRCAEYRDDKDSRRPQSIEDRFSTTDETGHARGPSRPVRVNRNPA